MRPCVACPRLHHPCFSFPLRGAAQCNCQLNYTTVLSIDRNNLTQTSLTTFLGLIAPLNCSLKVCGSSRSSVFAFFLTSLIVVLSLQIIQSKWNSITGKK